MEPNKNTDGPEEGSDENRDSAKTAFSAPSLVIYTGLSGKSGLRATIELAMNEGAISRIVYIHFCDDAELSKYKDTVDGPWIFHLPISMLNQVLQIVRNEPKKFLGYTWNNPYGNGTPIGKIGFTA